MLLGWFEVLLVLVSHLDWDYSEYYMRWVNHNYIMFRCFIMYPRLLTLTSGIITRGIRTGHVISTYYLFIIFGR